MNRRRFFGGAVALPLAFAMPKAATESAPLVQICKEEIAACVANAMSVSAMADECLKRGMDWQDVFEQRDCERRMAERLGLNESGAD